MFGIDLIAVFYWRRGQREAALIFFNMLELFGLSKFAAVMNLLWVASLLEQFEPWSQSSGCEELFQTSTETPYWIGRSSHFSG